MKSKFLKINRNDNVAVALENIKAGYTEGDLIAVDDIPFAHKILLKDLKSGDNVIKYGYPIGHINCDLKKGSYVHSHNLKTNLSDKFEYSFLHDNDYSPLKSELTFNGYVRSNGKVGIRNEIWIIPTVGCVNKTAIEIEKCFSNIRSGCDGVYALTHQFGCSQLGDDQENTRKILAALAHHPNAGGVLILSLGCENTNLSVFKKYLGNVDESRVKFLVCQDVADEIEEGTKLVNEIYKTIKEDKRQPVGIDKLVVGYKCGGSDAFSGITANALCGVINDRLTSYGATTVLTEVPEMFGAEQILMERSENKTVFDKQVDMINSFKEYFYSHGVVCYENPSPGNHDGGITTLEEKSLGCVQKGGKSIVTDVLKYGECASKNGLNLLAGPGNDMVSVTNLVCAGCQVVLFTTGRGTSLGAVVPTIKISSNSILFNKKRNWIDFNAGELINGISIDALADELQDKLMDILNGEKTKNELNNYRDISIFKDGVIM
ncbi:UxaA family hydrolase [uncultured Eubacterium sp.]|uniref:UxaA family hydrolase n=1 Tax=uncultured Eubacterium sp. TaxID=165185 RepID=UPI002585C06D|nr:altronate dehydratase family protein [uncultured Eubacterium sp.]